MNKYDDDESVYRYSDERRHDPEIREVVIDALKTQKEAVDEAYKFLVEADKILSAAPYTDLDSGMYYNAQNSVKKALRDVERKRRFAGDSENETYVGNLAASHVGERIKKDLSK